MVPGALPTRAQDSGMASEEDHIARIAAARGMEGARVARAEEEAHAGQKAAIAGAKRQRVVVLRGEVAASASGGTCRPCHGRATCRGARH
eukprot:11133687-Lingulodinium_polyedra.AAC.1